MLYIRTKNNNNSEAKLPFIPEKIKSLREKHIDLHHHQLNNAFRQKVVAKSYHQEEAVVFL